MRDPCLRDGSRHCQPVSSRRLCSVMDPVRHVRSQRINVDRQLRREQNSLFNCLHSIADDARFIAEIRSLYPSLPVFANLRCGLWYQKDFDGTCYFKSTDGHFSQWSFSTVRLNLNVAEACAQHGGCIIIDATRRGKRFPVRFQSPLLLCIKPTRLLELLSLHTARPCAGPATGSAATAACSYAPVHVPHHHCVHMLPAYSMTSRASTEVTGSPLSRLRLCTAHHCTSEPQTVCPCAAQHLALY